MTTLSTHVLDAALGRPAAGLSVALTGAAEEHATTDTDGRVRFEADLDSGVYALTFATGLWFEAAGRDTFFPEVVVTFAVDPGSVDFGPHLHVALLLSPYSYTTYRGS